MVSIKSKKHAIPLDAITGATKMTDDPIMRDIAVLKDRVEMLERECAESNANIDKMEMIIFAYKKITNLTITMDEADDDND